MMQTAHLHTITNLRALKPLLLLLLLCSWSMHAWGTDYTVSLANTSTTSYNDGNIKLSFSGVSQNGNGFELASTGLGSAEKDKLRGTVTWDSITPGYTIKVTKVVAGFKTDVKGGVTSWGTEYGIYGRVYCDDQSQYTAKMCKNAGTQTASATIQKASGFSKTVTFTAGRNSVGGKTYLNYVTLTYSKTATPYVITLNKQSGTGGAGSINVTFNASTNLTTAISVPTRTGYTFGGYYTNTNGKGTQLIDKDGNVLANRSDASNTYTDVNRKWKYANNITLYAKWTANSYDVTLHANSGTINAGNVTSYTYGVGATLPTNITRTGYDFGGWYDNSGCTGTAVTAISTTATGDKEYWAKWTASTYTITLHTNNGTINAGNVTSYTYGLGATLPTNVTRAGYTYGGWYANSGCTGTAVTTISTTATGDKEYWAKWTANTYMVSFDANGGSCGTADKTVTYDAAYGTLPPATRTGYTFDGWFTGKTDGSQVTSSTTVQITAAQTLYAHWTANTYTVSFNSHGGTAKGDATVTYDATYGAGTYWPSDPTRTGYTFNGWFTAETGGTQVTPDTKVQITAAQTLHAQWSVNDYTITLNNQSATTPGTESIAVTYDASTNLTAAIVKPTKDNCTFEGYFTGAKGTGVEIITKEGNVKASVDGYTDASCNWKYANDLVLYAYWKGNQTITWDLANNTECTTNYTFDATATSGLTVEYASSNTSVATIINGNQLNVIVANQEVTITASQDGDHDWNAAPDVVRTIITAGTRPNNYAGILATGLTYGQTLAESTLSGKVKLDATEIDGKLEWVDSAAVPNAGNIPCQVRFIPNNLNTYSSITFDVTVAVAQATPTITWNIGTNLRANSRYTNFFVSNSNGACTVTTSSNTLLSVSDNVLETGSVASATNGWIRVTQAATTNYKAITVAVQQNVTVNPRVNVCLPFTMTQSIFNDAKVGSKDNVYWSTTADVGFHDDYILNIDVYYSQKIGIAMGNYTEGLDGMWDAIKAWIADNGYDFKYTNKYVDLSFTGVPDSISFDAYSQQVRSVGWFLKWPLNVDWPATAQKWNLYESPDGNTYTLVGEQFEGEHIAIKRALKSNTRYVRIEYNGNFTGFITGLHISQKKYLTVDEESLTFGDSNERPLQEPQTITMRYSSLGDCGEVDPHIAITSSNPAFYVDEPKVVNNVGIDYMGVYTVRVRCNDVNQSGTLTLASSDGTKKATVTLSSAKPELTTTPHSIFQTGTEHAPGSGAYRALATVDYSKCFNGGTPLFDTVYVYGVSASAAGSRAWDDDVVKGYKVPVINVEAGNVHTPCFVYEKSGTKYVHRRTFDAATTTLNISTTDKKKKLAFIGYKPASLATNIPAIQISGSNPASVYLNNTEMQAKGAVLALSGIDTIFARGTNNLTSATDATVKFIAPSTELIINDNWVADEISGIINLKAADGKPSIELKSANDSVIIRGSQLKLQKANRMAIARMEGAAEKLDGAVHIYDGTILGADGADTLGMPYNTLIDGGTFNNGTVVVYKTAKWKARRPMNSRGDLLARYTMTKLDLENQYDWYGQAHLTLDDYAKVHPMLFDTTICIFNGKQDSLASHVDNWNKIPDVEGSDVIIDSAVVITEPISVNMLIIREQEGKDVSVTIAPTGGLTVGEGGIIGATTENLILKAGDDKAVDKVGNSVTGQTGFLRIDPECEELMPQATVELFSIAYYNMKSTERNYEGSWQYVGSPLAAGTSAKSIFTKSYIYSWDESRGDWVNNRASLVLQPFVGYATSQYKNSEGMLISYVGQLAENGEVVLPLTYSPGSADPGCNVLANSFTAPIDMTLFDLSDFSDGVEASIHLFNTGSEKDIDSLNNLNTKAINMNARGQYISVPVKNLGVLAGEFGYPTILPSMQGFYVNTSKAGTLTLNYKKLVWNSDYSKRQATPLRARQQDRQDEVSGAMCVSLSSNGGGDNMFLLESEDYAAEYENGYDSHKIMNGNLNVFAVADDDKLAVDATNSLIGTRVGVRTGEETSYTMSFSYLRSEDELALFDNETNETTDIDEGTVYTFYAEPNSEILGRFQIVGRAKAPSTPTGVNEVESDVKVHKFIKDNQLYILKNGVLYNGMGAVVR